MNQTLLFISLISISSAQTFFVPPLDTGVVGNGARTFDLQLQNGTTSFFPGIETETSGYNGNFLGPTLLMQKGDSVVINVTNTMPFATTTHWHGMHLPAVMDGGPHQLIEQNTTWVATWRIKNRASTYWYHPHPHPDGFPIDTLKATGWQVYQGMTGMLIVKDTETDTLGLPAEYGVDDIPIILQDRSFTADSSHFAPIPSQGSGQANIRRGYTIMVNGVVTPTLNSHAQMIRLRILNASNARTYRLGFSDNRPFFVIGSDGGILDTVSTVTRIDMSPAERYEIVVDFSDANGSTLKLMAFNSEIESHTYPNGLSGNIYWISPLLDDYDTSDFDIMTFNIGAPTANPVTGFNQELTEIVRDDPVMADNVNNPRPFVLAAPAGNGNGFTINGSMFDPSIINDIIQLGATEVWDIENTANMAHPFHIHGNSFQVVSRTNGVRPTHDYELGWKDVVVVYSQETVRIIKSFEDYADPESPYMSHCHILEHEDVGMMTHWVVADTIGGEVTALQFDGVDDRVTIPYDPSMPIESFTVSAWIKLQQPAGRAVIIARGEDDNSFNLSWQLYVKPNGTLEVMLEDSNEQNYCYPLNNCAPMGTCTVTGDLFVADDTWHHVAVTRDTSGILALYIDGENRAGCEETGVPSSNNFQDLSIGCTYGFIGPPPNGIEPPIWFFPGIIDEPAVWNRALNQDEISALFASGIELESDGLVGFWPFDEGNGQIVFDHSDLGNHGFLGEVSSEDSADPLWIYTQLSNEVEILPVFENVVLHPNFPNPFNPVTKIQFSLKDETVITLTLFDMLGRNVMELAKGMYPSGTHSFMIQMNQFPNGVYFYRITTPEKQITNKMLLLK
jgi:bilirubin oxidase